MKKLSFAVSAVALAAALLPALASAQNIAIVNGKAVPKARFESFMTQVTKQGNQPRTPELENQVKDELVLREIFVQEAEARGLQRSEEYRSQMDVARQSLLIRELFNDYQKKNAVSDAELKAEYDKLKGAGGGGNEYRARHILVEKEDEAKAIIAQLKKGAKFEDIAKKQSKDPGSGAQGGDLGWANTSGYVPEFAQALGKLGKGQMTDAPVKSQFGYHVIRVDDVREAKGPEVPAFEQVKPQVVQQLQQQKLVKFQEELRAKAKVE